VFEADESDDLLNVGDVWWYEAPIPPKRHQCETHTSGTVRHVGMVQRCACGAIKVNDSPWLDRNSRQEGD